MLKKHIVATLILISFSGCKTQYAHFQGSSIISIPKVINKKSSLEIAVIKVKPALLNVEKIKINNEISFVPTYFPKPSVKNRKVKIPVFQESIFHTTIKQEPDPKAKEKRKKKQKRQKFWRQMGSNLLIGVMFLGIAIILSIIHLPTLALLFGVASILFLIFGLKKIFRKRNRRIRNPFK